MDKQIDFSIIIVSFSTRSMTRACLSSVFLSLKRTVFSYEVIVIDNASTDGSVEMIKKEFPKVILIENKKNTGYGVANNQAAKKAQGELIFFLNSDTVVLDDAIEKLVTYATTHSEVSFLGGKLLNTDNSSQASCGPFLTLPIVFLMLFFKGEQLQITRYSPEMIREVDWISGACILTKRNNFQKLNGFDEGIFLYMEEVELLYRAQKLGMRTFFYPQARFIHVGSGSSKEWKTPIVNLYKGLIYFYKKHKSPAELFLLRFLLVLKALVGLVVGAICFNKRILNAYKDGLRVSFQN